MTEHHRTPRRIHITGGQGSGKTRLAALLSARLGIPAYDLDLVGWDARSGRERPLHHRLAAVRRLASQPAWITEGTMLGWTDQLFRSADLVIWLDVPWRMAVWRMLKRHVRASLAGRNRHPGVRRLLRFIWYTRRYYLGDATSPAIPIDGDGRASRRATAQRLTWLARCWVRCRKTGQVDALLARLSPSPLSGRPGLPRCPQ